MDPLPLYDYKKGLLCLNESKSRNSHILDSIGTNITQLKKSFLKSV